MAVYRLQPEPNLLTTPAGVTVAPRVEGQEVILDVGNRSSRPVSVELSCVRLAALFANNGAPETLRPVEPEPITKVLPGQQQKFSLRFNTDIDSPNYAQQYELLLNRALSLGVEGIELDPKKLVPKVVTKWEPERTHVALLGGFGYDYLYGASFLSGFGEFRLGGHQGPVEVTGRLRLQPGHTLTGPSSMHLSLGHGVLFVVQPRVRFGLAISVPPSFLEASGYGCTMFAWTYDVHAELLVDLAQGVHGAMFASARFGVTGDLTGTSHPYLLGPSMLLGLEYRLR